MGLPLILPIALSLAQSIPNWMAGIKQNRLANDLQSELKRPDFEIPESQTQALNSAKNQASMTRLPGQSGIEGRLDQTTANQLDSIERLGVGGAMGLNAASQAFGNQQSKENELGTVASQQWTRNQDVLRSQLDRMSEWEFKKWAWDKQMPYQNKAEAIAALREGSMRNFDNAAKDTFGGAANMLLADSLYGNKDLSWVDKMFGGSNSDKGSGPMGEKGITGVLGGIDGLVSGAKDGTSGVGEGGTMGVMDAAKSIFSGAYPLATELNLKTKPLWSQFDMGMPQ
jgi:hypothetical protein